MCDPFLLSFLFCLFNSCVIKMEMENTVQKFTLGVWYEVSNSHLFHKVTEDLVLLLSPLSLPERFSDVALVRLEAHESCPIGLKEEKKNSRIGLQKHHN